MRFRQRARFAGEILFICLLLLYFRFLRPAPVCTDPIDWTQYAYMQYVTNSDYLCNSVMMFERLHALGSKAKRLMLVPRQFGAQHSWLLDLMLKARDEYDVRLQLVDLQTRGDDPTWSQSFTKLLAFNQTQYQRVLVLDSDATLLRHMDELFTLPSTPVAMPRAYFLPQDNNAAVPLTSAVLLVEPSISEAERIRKAISVAGEREFDMEVLNKVYGQSAMVLPHRPYLVVTGEFRRDALHGHDAYLGSSGSTWDAARVRQEAKYVHFSDWPMPKPWISPPVDFVTDQQPECNLDEHGVRDCTTREVWWELYADFAARRKSICNLDAHKATLGLDGELGIDPSLTTGLLSGEMI